MSMELMASSERVCYVHCNLCNTILAVSVPSLNSLQRTAATVVTVRCGHCSNLLSVNIGAASLQYCSLPSPPSPAPPPPTPPNHPIHFHSHPNLHSHQKQHQVSSEDSSSNKDYGSSSSSSTSSKYTKFLSPSAFDLQSSTIATVEQPRLSPIRPPEKRQRVPSAYNKFIKEEIQRIKASNPDISHREAFSTAAKNWAHFPHIHFGLKLESNKQAKLDHQAFAGEQGTQKSTNGLY